MALPSKTLSFRRARILLIVCCAAVCIAVAVPPLLVANSHPLAGEVLYLLFTPVCHQMQDRSFVLLGGTLAVCHRCAGIYSGFFLSLLLPLKNRPRLSSRFSRRNWVLCAAAPMLLDTLLPYAGIWSNSAWSRYSTGLLFGAMAMVLVTKALQTSCGGGLYPANSGT